MALRFSSRVLHRVAEENKNLYPRSPLANEVFLPGAARRDRHFAKHRAYWWRAEFCALFDKL
jgi:hypothetical protein